jgi:hypothetical protein
MPNQSIRLSDSILYSNDYNFFSIDSSQNFVTIELLLRNVNFFSYVEKNDYLLCIEQIKRKNSVFIRETNRIAVLDAECIDEGMAIEELDEIFALPVFKYTSLSSKKFSDYWDGYNYMVQFDNLTFFLWNTEESVYQKDPWKLSLSRLVHMINNIMLINNISEQFYYDYEGTNDTKCVFLSSKMVSVLSQLKLMKAKELC